jgi:hypothetical protein
MAERLKQIGEAAPRQAREPNLKICVWCSNKGGEACVTRCQKEGRYSHLDPEELEPWEPGPRLPQFRELLRWSPNERLAILFLVTLYQGRGR